LSVADTANGADAMTFLLNVPLEVTVELGSVSLPVAEILKLGTGSVVELDRPVNAPVDLLVNDRKIARGEIVAVDDRFALRITELIPTERSS
jgi:flagellar motor switch protein FliN/FliY